MRLTLPLTKRSTRYFFKQIWKTKGVMKEAKFVMPRILVEKGITPEDVGAPKPKPLPHWEPPVPDDPRFMPEMTDQNHPDYKETPIYEFNSECKLLEGEDQALILTKSQPFYELPEHIQNLMSKEFIPDQDELVQRYIMQAFKWDPTKDKLPKRHNPDLPIWKFKAEFGIPRARSTDIVVSNMLRLCQSLGGKYPDLLTARRTSRDHHLSSFYYFGGDKHIQIQGCHDFLLTSNRVLPPFASEERVDESVTHELPDLYPIAPTIDLKKQHVWRLENHTGWRQGFSHRFPHTMLYNNRDLSWTTGECNARAILFCFAHCVALAKEMHGWEVTKLPEPISIQCVHTDGVSFHFLCYQLNTLSLNNKDGIKNFVWIDSDNKLYNRIEPKRAMLRNTKYEDYDPDVFKKFLAFYLNGADLYTVVENLETDSIRTNVAMQ